MSEMEIGVPGVKRGMQVRGNSPANWANHLLGGVAKELAKD